MIRLGPAMIPCRGCAVGPGEPCKRKRPGEFHAFRHHDADRASELLDDRLSDREMASAMEVE